MAAIRTTIFTRKSQPSRDRTLTILMTPYRKLTTKINQRIPEIMKGAADIILSHILPHVPIETGALRASGKAEAVRVKSGGWAAQVSFGGPDNRVTRTKNTTEGGVVEYAIFVNWGWPGGQDPPRIAHHFMEQGGEESKREVEDFVLTNLKRIEI